MTHLTDNIKLQDKNQYHETNFDNYHEYGLPTWLEKSVHAYMQGEKENVSYLDCLYCELQSDINVAELGHEITSETAWYLREKYLGLVKEENEEIEK